MYMLQKVQWWLRLIGFITIGISLFMGDKAALTGAIGGVIFILGFIRLPKSK